MISKNLDLLHDKALGYEAPSIQMVDISSEGVLCGSDRDIADFVLLDEQDW